MLSFAAEFPIDRMSDQTQVRQVLIGWVVGSPHTDFLVGDFDPVLETGQWSKKKGNQTVEMATYADGGQQYIAMRNTQIEDHVEWCSEIVFHKRGAEDWVGIRTSREALRPGVRLQNAKKPRLVEQILRELSGGMDWHFSVDEKPYVLQSLDLELAASIVVGDAENHLPIVYVSCRFDGSYPLDVDRASRRLSGMAHVVVEPNAAFARRLRINVASANVYGGAVGIYWPNGSGSRTVFLERDFDNAAMMQAVETEVRTALVDRRPRFDLTWAGVQEVLLRKVRDDLRSEGSAEVQKYAEAFDGELCAKNEQLSNAEAEIRRLKAEIRKYEARSSNASGLLLNVGDEHEYYPNEIYGVVIDALRQAVEQVQSDGRRHHILSSIVGVNERVRQPEDMRSTIKELLREYRSLTPEIQSSLQRLGFEISSDGKHHKLVYHGDERYVFVLPKSGSDRRGGLNCASDIAKRVF